ncbi:hypothetical protein DYE50_01090 [Treponema ruminis]|uniref:Outer membrane protein beta-barrel domain-containing protein n=1 Tax=Treponema ruminis TaxID=744515 RepID=A0A7W8GBB1_9SPIR|nr:hypothetical protein [Treponema ruminis]MBB5227308.1 hypothetical protein [Treponema ruminis]QSI01178.1 hypothetical protein DYE50_01090 [Treponema ruminis]
MKRFLALFCALFMISSFAFADDDDADIYDDIDQGEEEDDDITLRTSGNINEAGDQYIKIGLMVTCPLNFGGSFPLYKEGKLATGGAGMIGYHRFITNWWAAGINIYFGYHPTLGENIFTYIPFVVDTTFQPTFKKFEFPITLGVGAAMENYLSRTYFPGLVLRGAAGVFYRATPSWSFGVEGDCMYMPQWYSNPKYNDYGVFGSMLFTARYHF